MREQDRQSINAIVNRIQNTRANQKLAYDITVQGSDIVEPYLLITMWDYRKLCRLINVPDTLTPPLDHTKGQ